jgi:hypothetical protein
LLKADLSFSDKPRRNLKELELSLKAGFGNGRTFSNFEEARDAVIIARINNSECILDFDQRIVGKRVEFKLKIREKSGNTDFRSGDCSANQMPTLGPITVEYDDDDDPSTPNTPLFQNN